jgi:thiol-disulfide isomerase/thioredoxin
MHLKAGRAFAVLATTIIGLSLLIWAGVHNARQRKLEQQQAQASKVALIRKGSANEAAAGDDGFTPKLQGKPAPGFTLVDLDGKKVSLADYKGKPVLVNFWATWCGPCKEEMPWLEEFHQKYAADGLVILGVASDEAPKTMIVSTTKKLGVTYPVLLTDGKVESLYGGIDYMPESFYVDRSGKVTMETAGITDGQGGKDQIEANLKKLVATAGQ